MSHQNTLTEAGPRVAPARSHDADLPEGADGLAAARWSAASPEHEIDSDVADLAFWKSVLCCCVTWQQPDQDEQSHLV